MWKALLKKQIMEINAWLIQNRKNGKQRSKGTMVLLLLMWAAIFFSLGSLFYMVGDMLCEPLVISGFGWLYLALMGLMAIALGVFGSVFNTYSTLYQAKDNELLLSMPVPPSRILTVRLLGVWLWSLIYEAIAFFPALLVYWKVLGKGIPAVGAPGSGLPLFPRILSGVLLLFLLSVFILTLSCILGWVVAKAAGRLKGKSFVTVFFSVAFIVLYYWGYSKAYGVLQSILANAETVGDTIRGAAYPLYLMGRAGEGEPLSLVLFTGMVILLFVAVWLVLSRSFLRMATANGGGVKARYRETAVKRKTVSQALLSKELRRFTSSSTYMLNCGLGTLLLPAAGIFMVIKAEVMRQVLPSEGSGESLSAAMLCAALCMMASMNDITAPSVSLEGKNLWLAQSLPVSTWEVLKAKLKLHVYLTELPMIFCAVCVIAVMRPAPVSAVLLLVLPALFVGLNALFGLAVNLKMPNLKWRNETVAVKQSMGVLLAMMGGWVFVIALGALYLAVCDVLTVEWYLLLCAGLVALLSAGLLLWLKKRGTKIFDAL